MGKEFGNLGPRIRHSIVYTLSPYEQRPFRGMLTKSPGNLVRRFFDQVFFVTPGLLAGFMVYYFAKRDHDRRKRKNPEDFANDE